MKIKGKIIKIGKSEQVSDNFKKRLLVVETDEKYPQQIPLEFVQDKTCELDGFHKGDIVEVAFNLRGREWNGKYFVNLNGWKIQRLRDHTQSQTPAEPPTAEDKAPETNADDLPF